MTRPGPHNDITDVAGVCVGHHTLTDDRSLTGVTVVVPPKGTTAGVDVRGAAPGTRETDLLDPVNLVDAVDAVVLSGGSAYGLATADGVMAALEEDGRGWPIAGGVVPIVPAAVVFDLGRGGDIAARPGAGRHRCPRRCPARGSGLGERRAAERGHGRGTRRRQPGRIGGRSTHW